MAPDRAIRNRGLWLTAYLAYIGLSNAWGGLSRTRPLLGSCFSQSAQYPTLPVPCAWDSIGPRHHRRCGNLAMEEVGPLSLPVLLGFGPGPEHLPRYTHLDLLAEPGKRVSSLRTPAVQVEPSSVGAQRWRLAQRNRGCAPAPLEVGPQAQRRKGIQHRT